MPCALISACGNFALLPRVVQLPKSQAERDIRLPPGPRPHDGVMTSVATGLDLAGYLDRVGYGRSTDPTLDTLHGLVAAHNRSIPFENLDPLLGVPVADLGPGALTAKLVHRRRGGYCYEHNGLMGYVLEALGYGVDRLAGRVVWMREPDAPLPAQTHNVLSVTVP